MEWGSSPLLCGQSESSRRHWNGENTEHQLSDSYTVTRPLTQAWCNTSSVMCGSLTDTRWIRRTHLIPLTQPTYLVPHGTFFTSSVCSVVWEAKTKVLKSSLWISGRQKHTPDITVKTQETGRRAKTFYRWNWRQMEFSSGWMQVQEVRFSVMKYHNTQSL